MPDPQNLDETVRLPLPERPAFGRYRLKQEIGRGGMGVVWQAEDTKLQRDVALKFLPDHVVRDREAMAGLAAETRRCLALTHPNIVRVYDLIEEGGRAAISMEFVDGPSLAERKLREPDRCFPLATLRPWITQLCAALDHAHTKARIVHRDLKPLNLLVNAEGDLKVVDFGISRSLQAEITRRTAEVQAASVSLGYASPQQVLGEPAAVSDDLYSLGATLYELLTGKPPFFEGDIITQLREVVPPTLAARRAALGVAARETVPAEWEQTIAACLAKRPEDRPKSAVEVARRLGLAPDGAAQPRRFTPARLAAALAAAAAAGILFFVGLRQGSGPGAGQAAGAHGSAALPEFALTVAPAAAGARVWIGGETDRLVPDSGTLVLSTLPPGEYELTVQAPGHKPSVSRVTVGATRSQAAVTLEPVWAPLELTARPGTAVTVIDARGRETSLGTVPANGSLRLEQAVTAGTYRFRFHHPECLDAELPDIAATSGRPTRVSAVQIAKPGELRVTSNPEGADVLLGGVKVGTTPASISLPSEKPQAVEVMLPGYRREKRSLTLKPGEKQTLAFEALVPEGGSVGLRRRGKDFDLPRATIRVDGATASASKGRIDRLEVGARQLEIIHPDYQPWKQPVTIRDRQVTPVDVVLVPRPAEVTFAVTGPASFSVAVNGKAATLRNGTLAAPAEEEFTLEISAAGFRTDRRRLTLAPRSKQKVTVTLEKVSIPQVGQPWTVPELDLVLLPVAGGTFAMGSERGDLSERPKTDVTISKPFWLGRTEVTQREWTAVMGANPSRAKGDTLPVENVSWQEAVEFCRKLTARERAADRLPPGHAYALPTEAQWELACRAGATADAPENVADVAWHGRNSRDTSHPVAALPANPWGFHDLLGNVWEWCSDVYAEKLKGGAVTDPKGTGAGVMRVRRGASYVIGPDLIRYSTRGKLEADSRMHNVGFRVALIPAP